MKIDLIGSGGREAAIKWKLEKDGHVVTNNYPDLAFVGPEAPLANNQLKGLNNQKPKSILIKRVRKSGG